MEFTFTIDDSIAKRVIQDVCNKLSYDPASGQSQVDFMVNAAVDYLLGAAVQEETDVFTRTTMATASQDIAVQTALIHSQLTIQGTVTKQPPVE